MSIEYGSFRNFLVSAGVALIIGAFVIPWLFFKESFDLLITQEALNKLTPTARHIINQRQEGLDWIIPKLIYFTIISLFGGLILCFCGLKQMKKTQDMDNEEKELNLQKLRPMTTSEVGSRVAEEVQESSDDITEQEPDVSTNLQNNYASRYLALRGVLESKIQECLKGEYNVLINQKLDGAEYDMILRHNSVPYDIILELKFTLKKIGKMAIRNQAIQLSLSCELYEQNIGRPTVSAMIFVYPDNTISDGEIRDIRSYVNGEMKRRNSFSYLIFMSDEELNKLSCEQIKEKFPMYRESVVSSNVRSIGYDEPTKVMEVEFKNNSIYRYFDVPNRVYDEILGASSTGGYLAAKVKGVYRYKQIK